MAFYVVLSTNRSLCSVFKWMVELFISLKPFVFVMVFVIILIAISCVKDLIFWKQVDCFVIYGGFIILLTLLSVLIEQCLFSPVTNLQHDVILESNYFCANVSFEKSFLILRSSNKVGLRLGVPWLNYLNSFYYKARFPFFCKVGLRFKVS